MNQFQHFEPLRDGQLDAMQGAIYIAWVIFTAYGISSVPFAMAISSMWLGTPLWSRTALAWMRISALLYTAALGLGGLWAYEVLGWGGYWAWDPVETASWLPWLGTIATQDANSVAITGGAITGITDLAVVDGGTGASSTAGARTSLRRPGTIRSLSPSTRSRSSP